MKYYLIKQLQGFVDFLSSDKRLLTKHISFVGRCCAEYVPKSWTKDTVFSVLSSVLSVIHILGTTLGFISCLPVSHTSSSVYSVCSVLLS